jgi:hypothetical protein
MTPNPATNTANKAQIEKEKEKEGVTNATRHSRLPGTSLGEKKKRQVSIPTSTSPTLSMKIRRLTTQRSRLLQTSAPATAVSPPPRLRARLLCQTQKSPQRYVSSCSLPTATSLPPPTLTGQAVLALLGPLAALSFVARLGCSSSLRFVCLETMPGGYTVA